MDARILKACVAWIYQITVNQSTKALQTWESINYRWMKDRGWLNSFYKSWGITGWLKALLETGDLWPCKNPWCCVCSSNTKRGKYGGAWQMACKPNWASRRNRNWWTPSVSIARKKARPLAWKLILKDAWRIAVVRLQAWVNVCTCLIKFLQIFCQSCYSVQVCVWMSCATNIQNRDFLTLTFLSF